MKNRFCLFLVFVVLGLNSVNACDACGSSMSISGIGLLPALRNNYVSLSWQFNKFNSLENESSIDKFHTIDFSARYYFTDKLKVIFNQPFRINIRDNDEETIRMSGISDTRILASYTIFQGLKLGKSELFCEAGAGVKIPIGKYNANIHEMNVPDNFNVGSGSWGFILRPNFVWTLQKTGFLLNMNYMYSEKSRDSGYRFGQQFAASWIWFYEQNLSDKFVFNPNLGLKYEWVSVDKYDNGNEVHGTGGNGLYLSAGADVKNEKWLTGLSYAYPLYSGYSDRAVEASSRYAAYFSYFF